mgnify:CR=1 FL=1
MAQVNTAKNYSNKQIQSMTNKLQGLINNWYMDEDVRNLLENQLKTIIPTDF